MAVLVNGTRVLLPESERRGTFMRWRVERIQQERARGRDKRRAGPDAERIAVVQMDGVVGVTEFAERFAARFVVLEA